MVVTNESAKPIYLLMKLYKVVLILAIAILTPFTMRAQAPVITSVNKYVAATGTRITIVGSNFGTNPANLAVFFGAAKANLLSVTNQLLEVSVPSGATFENITVTNTSTGLTAYSNDPFLPSYGGEHPFVSTDVQGQFDFNASSGLYDICVTDLDGDGKNDIASVAEPLTAPNASITLFRNTSTPGTVNFTATTLLSIITKTLHVQSGDLNGDGKPDLVISEGGASDKVIILKNSSSPGSFSFSFQNISLSGTRPKRIEIADLDLDGKPELILTDQGTGKLTVLPNSSSLASISFAAPKTFTVTGATNTDGLSIEDLNGDQLPDIVMNQILLPNVFILHNNSSQGNIKLENQITLTVSGNLANVRVGDLDGDHKPDIAVTRWLSSSISVFLNQGTNGQIGFTSPTTIATDTEPWGIDFGDIDGDQKKDIVISSTQKTVTVLNNESTPGNLSFQKSTLPTTFINRHVRISDFDGDSKPDIAFTSIDDNNLGVAASKVSVFRNRNCFVPKIDQTGPLTICSSFPLRLNSSLSAGTTYEWKKDGSTVATGTTAYYDVTATGQYTVTAISESGSCNKVSNAVDITVVSAGTTGAITFGSNPPVCVNGTLSVTVMDANGLADGFEWTGPENFTSSGSPLTRSNFKAEYAGRYDVNVKIGSCIAAQSHLLVDVVTMPVFKVSYAGSEVICATDTKTLSVSPSTAGFSYQWFNKINGPIAGETNTSYTASASGDYYYEAQSTLYPSCPAVESNSVKISAVAIPVASFDSPVESCRNGIVQFTNQSTTDPSATASYLWDFGDGQTATTASPTHSFTTIQTFNVKLSVSYAGGSCLEEITKPIKIVAAPSAAITTASNTFQFCQGENLTLEVNGTFTTYLWSTTETTPSITINKAGTYLVDVTTSSGCKLSLSQLVNLFPAPQVVVEATPENISSGESVQLNASGLVSYDWDPGKLVSDSTIANPTALPLQNTVFKVKGAGSNGCMSEGTVEVKVKGESAVSKLKPSNFFSPNGDVINNLWTVDNILSFPQCAITIYDDKGIKLYEAKPYMNDWDGSFQGKLLPNGVYFYIIRCDGEESNPKTGSITLIR